VGPDQPYALLLPGASRPSRRYHPDRFAAVARLLGEAGLQPVVAGAATEADLVQRVSSAAPGSVALSGCLDVPALASAITASAVVVCNNSGGADLAAATGTPAVVLFAGAEQVREYGPRHTAASIRTVRTRCSPCRQPRCPYATECLDVPAERVAEEALRLAVSAHRIRAAADRGESVPASGPPR
jgi:ADP-heptose:LPS heptosyltransferase